MTRRARVLLLLAGLACSALTASDNPAKPAIIPPRTPEIFSLNPVGSLPGRTLRVSVLGENLDGRIAVVFDHPGITGTVVRNSFLGAEIEIGVAPGTPPRMYPLRLKSELGISNLLGFRVGDLPEYLEQEPNDSRQNAQAVEWPAVIDAVLQRDEDADFYRVHAKEGQRLTMEVVAARNGSGLNAEMYLLDGDGRRLAVADEEESSDPVITYRFMKAGDYFVVIRAVFNVLNISFPTGHPAYTYQLRVSTPPKFERINPSGSMPNREVDVTLSGERLDDVRQLSSNRDGITSVIVSQNASELTARLKVDANASGVYEFRAVSPSGSSAPVRFIVDDYEARQEQEPKDERANLTVLPLPGAVEGAIARGGDVDTYRFHIAAPSTYVFEVMAGRLNSHLDSILELLDSSGKVVLTNDDGDFGEPAQGDARIEYAFAEPGEYFLRVRQAILELSGPRYAYRLIARRARPHFTLAPGSASGNFAIRAADRILAVPGTTIKIPLTVQWREGLEGLGADVKISVEGLPPELTPAPVWAKVSDGKYSDKQALLTASLDLALPIPEKAKLESYAVAIRGEAIAGGNVLANAGERLRLSGSGRYVMASTGGFPFTLDRRYVSVVEAAPLTLRPEVGDERYPIRFTMQPGTKKTLTISVLPPERFQTDVKFTAENIPPGLEIEHVEPRPETGQYILHLKTAPACGTGWFPLVSFIATIERAGARTVVPSPYFGIAIR